MNPVTAQRQADELAERLDQLEKGARARLSGPLAADLARVGVEGVARWTRAYGGVERQPAHAGEAGSFLAWLVEQLVRALRPERLDREALPVATRFAYSVGLDHAEHSAWWDHGVGLEQAPRPSADLARPLVEQLDKALAGINAPLLAARGYVAVQDALRHAMRAAHRIDAAISVELTQAAGQAVRDVATEERANVVWVAERNGCLDCLAYAGMVSTSGTPFPGGLSFDTRTSPGPALLGPPKHPHCRCALQVLHPSDTEMAAALRREAKRSVLRGWADDSDRARVRAADALLAQDPRMPKSVQEAARRAVQAGTFGRK